MASPANLASTERGFARVQIDEKRSVLEGAAEFDYSGLHSELVATFNSGKTMSLEWRKQQLQQLVVAVKENYEAIREAIQLDHSGGKLRTFFDMDMGKVATEMLANLDSWAAPLRVKHTEMLGGHSEVRASPKGVVLLIAPWNYPVTLVFKPLAAIIAAGNCCVVKPSEVSSNSAKVIEMIINKYLDPAAFRVVQGEVPETTALLKLRFDHIMYTGNGGVARIVMKAAAEHLTPCTLELGGKSPTFVCKSAKMKAAVERIGLAKFINAGQTCVAPDYVLVHRSREKEFAAEFKKAVGEWFKGKPEEDVGYGRVINERHTSRLARIVDNSGGEITLGGSSESSGRYYPPTIVSRPLLTDPIMTEELFGPLLPILPFDTIEEAVALSKRICQRPLALYVFSEDSKEIEQVLNTTTSGGVAVNSALEQLTNSKLPFGGVGESGMGKYQGKWGFDEFSHHRAVFYKDTTFSQSGLVPTGSLGNDFLYDMAVKMEITGFLSDGQKTALKLGLAAATAGLLLKLRSRL